MTARDAGVRGVHLEDLLDGVDCRGEQRLHFLVIVDIVSVANAHEEDISWQTGNGGRNCAGSHV